MSNPAVPLGSLPVGGHFTFSGSQEGVVVERLPSGVSIRLRERKDGRWVWRENIWAPSMQVTPVLKPRRMTPINTRV